MRKKHISIGQRFGRLVVTDNEARDTSGKRAAVCKCDCGNITIINIYDLLNGLTKSCVCIRKTHGKSKTNLYKVWTAIIDRCNNPKSSRYSSYGGRGITVCERWHKFENFYDDMGECPDGMSIERKHNDKGYNPDNCKWATSKEQQRNRRNNLLYTINGQTMCLKDWCEDAKLNYGTVRARVRYLGWSIERALGL